MTRKLLGGVALLAGTVVLAAPAPAPAQVGDVADGTSCTTKEIVECVREWIVCAPPGCVPPGTTELIRRLTSSIDADVNEICRLVTGADCP